MSEQRPALRPTEPATLVVGGLAAAAIAWLLVSNLYRNMPPLGWPPVIIIGGLAALEAVIARNTSARVHRAGRVLARGGANGPEPVEPLTVARFAVLAKASSLAGAIFIGFFAGVLPWLAIESARLADAAADLPPAIGGLVVSGALIAAALWLERACRVPEQPEEEQEPDQGDTT